MLVIWGRTNSVNVQKVLWCCDELALKYQRHDAGGPFGVVNTPQYRGLNPNGLVPTIEDDGYAHWESNAVIRYLAAKHAAGNIWPEDLHIRAEADQWMDWSNTTFWPAIRPLFLGLIRTAPEKRDPKLLEESRQKTIEALGILDNKLASSPYLGGEAFSMGDIPVGAGVWRWMALPIERPAFLNVQRWFDLLAQRPAYRQVIMQPLT